MASNVKWRKNRQSWYLYVYANGTENLTRLGPDLADKRRGEREARKLNRLQREGKLGLTAPKPKPVLFGEFADRWYRNKLRLPLERGEEGHLRPKTVAMRDETLRLHLKPLLGKIDIREIDVSTLENLYAHWLATGKPRSRRSRQIAMTTLRIVLSNALAEKIVASNAVDAWKAVQPKGVASQKTVDRVMVLDAEERELLLETAERLRPEAYPFILFLAETGCRIGEARHVCWSDVDLERRVVSITRQKTGGQRTAVELSPRLLEVLRRVRPDIFPPDLLAFPGSEEEPKEKALFRRQVWSSIVRTAFGRDRRVTPHMLRHTWASLHLARGTPLKWIQHQGGWASAKMLLDTYGEYMPSEQSGYAVNLAPRPDQTRPTRRLGA